MIKAKWEKLLELFGKGGGSSPDEESDGSTDSHEQDENIDGVSSININQANDTGIPGSEGRGV